MTLHQCCEPSTDGVRCTDERRRIGPGIGPETHRGEEPHVHRTNGTSPGDWGIECIEREAREEHTIGLTARQTVQLLALGAHMDGNLPGGRTVHGWLVPGIVPTLHHGPRSADRITDQRHWLVGVQTERAERLGTTDTESEHGSSTAQLVECGRGRAERTGVPQHRRGDADAESNPRGFAGGRRKHHPRIAGNTLVGHPDLVQTCSIGRAHSLDERVRTCSGIEPDPSGGADTDVGHGRNFPTRATLGAMTHVLRNALLPDGRRVDISVDAGRITAVGAAGSAPGTAAGDDLGGRLVIPGMVEPHAHIDKALTADAVPNPRGDLDGAIEAWIAAAQRGQFTYEDMVLRARAALERLLLNGTTAVRTHVNVGGGVGVMHVRAVKEAITEFAGLMDIQIVALTSSPMTGADGAENRASLIEAMELGVDLVGGCPHLDPDPQGLIDNALAVAADAGAGLDLHIDETLDPHMLSLQLLARSVMNTGFAHPVSASHCVSLSVVPLETQQVIARQVAEARISVIPLPQTNLFLQGWHHDVAMPRGIAPINVLREAGVLVAAGADNVQDPFNPMGRSDALETAALLVMAAHQLPDAAMDLVGNAGREVLGLPRVEMRVGDPADLVAIAAPSVRGALADAPRDRIVYRQGRRVAQRSETSSISR